MNPSDTAGGQCLVHVKSYDDVLTTVYKHTDAIYDFGLVHGLLMGMYFVISNGWAIDGSNRFASAFDRNLVDKLDALFESVYGSKASEGNKMKWSTATFGSTYTCEHFAELLLQDIAKYCASNFANDAKAEGVLRMVGEIKEKYNRTGVRVTSGRVCSYHFNRSLSFFMY